MQEKNLMGNFDGFTFDFEQRCDSIIEEGDLARLQKEFDWSYKKQAKEAENLANGLRADG